MKPILHFSPNNKTWLVPRSRIDLWSLSCLNRLTFRRISHKSSSDNNNFFGKHEMGPEFYVSNFRRENATEKACGCENQEQDDTNLKLLIWWQKFLYDRTVYLYVLLENHFSLIISPPFLKSKLNLWLFRVSLFYFENPCCQFDKRVKSVDCMGRPNFPQKM